MLSRVNRVVSVVGVLALFMVVAGMSSCDKGGGTVEITILHTNDIHSTMRPAQAGSDQNPYGLGGLARLKTLVDQIRAKKPDALLLDGGDWSEGNMYYSVDAGSNMLRILDAIGYDATVVGNHDFLAGPTQLASTIERANVRFPVLGANRNLDLVPNKARLGNLLKEYTIIERNGIKIGIIGLLCDDVLYYPFFKPAIVTNPVERATQLAKKLHDEKLADIIILLSHNNIDKHALWAKQVPWVNVIVSGHAHKKTSQPIQTTNAGQPAYVIETKEWAQFLGEFTLTVDTKTHHAKMKSYELHPVSSAYAEDPKIAAIIDESDRALAAKYGRDVSHDHAADVEGEMTHEVHNEGPVGNLAADAYREAANSDAAMEIIMLTSVMPPVGPATSRDIMDIAPHVYSPLRDGSKPYPEFGTTWTLKRLMMRGQDIRALMNVVFLTQTVGIPLGWIATSGIHVTYSRSGGASPVKTVQILNKATGQYEAVKDDQRYSVALHDGLLLAFTEIIGRLHLGIDLSRQEETGIQTWQALLDFATARKTIRASDYEAGTRFRTLEHDLSFYYHSVRVTPKQGGTGYVVSVEIQNEGLTASPAGYNLHVTRGAPNDVLNDDSISTVSARADVGPALAVPPLAPGARTVLQMPWDDVPGPGVYALNAWVDGPVDGNKENNGVKIHYTVP